MTADPNGSVVHTIVDTVADSGRLTTLHRAPTRAALRETVERELVDLLPFLSLAIVLEETENQERVECTVGLECPFEEAQLVGRDDWQPKPGSCHSLDHEGTAFGRVLVAGEIPAERQKHFDALLLHYAAALTNVVMREEANASMERMCASLHAFQEGVVLFQMPDRETAAARFLQLGMNVLGGQAGALYLLRELNDVDSGLVLNQALGVPEEVLLDLEVAGDEGGHWAEYVMQHGAGALRREAESGQLELLDNDRLPPMLQNVVGAPLSFHGVAVGVCVLLNVDDNAAFEERMESARHLFELGAAVFHRMQLEHQALRSRQIETQLEIASVIQSRFVPERSKANNLDVAWRSVMSTSVGGDYIDFFPCESGGYLATVSDVSGHGIDSALMMTSFRAAYRAEAQWFSSSDVLCKLNNVVNEEVGDTGMFLTSVSLLISDDQRRFAFSSAGHNPVMLYRAADGRVDQLESSGPPLGVFAGASYEEEVYEVLPGDVLLLYTDGVVEAAAPTTTDDADEDMYGEERLEALLRQHAGDGAQTVVDEVYRSVKAHTLQETQEDDITVLVLRFG